MLRLSAADKNRMLTAMPPSNFSIDSSTRAIAFDKGAVITQTPATFWLITKGAVKTLTWDETGKVITLGYWGAGDVIGLPFSAVDPYEVQCLSNVEARSVPDCHSSQYAKEITFCLRQTDELLRILRIERMYYRLYQLLLWLGNKFGDRVAEGILINIRLTHQELADLIGSTRVTVTRLLNQLETEQKILRPGRFNIILQND